MLLGVWVALGLLQQGAGLVFAEGEHMLRTRLLRQRDDALVVGRGADKHGWIGIADEVFDFSLLVGRIERQEDVSGAQCGQIQDHGFHGFFYLHGDAAGIG